MDRQSIDSPNSSVSAPVVSDAVGVSGRNWYVAVVRSNTEKSVGDRLQALGHECYVAVQREERIRKNGRKAVIDRVVIPSVVFVRCSEKERREVVALPFVNRFLTDRASTPLPSGARAAAIVPSEQISRLKFMVGNSPTPVTFSPHSFRKGEKVKVIRGSLMGLEGEIEATDEKHCTLTVSLSFLGDAHLEIETINVEKTNHG